MRSPSSFNARPSQKNPFAVLFTLLSRPFLGAWVLMLLLGLLYAEFGWLKPLSYWTSFGLNLLLGAVSARLFDFEGLRQQLRSE